MIVMKTLLALMSLVPLSASVNQVLMETENLAKTLTNAKLENQRVRSMPNALIIRVLIAVSVTRGILVTDSLVTISMSVLQIRHHALLMLLA